ncbi:MAG: YbaB/EbfC family nucleoid-associated protein [Planctomycetota bacterium]|nr:YbaB/EbfC family nucleoid-associated protein [Planctomycetota bacterium]MDA1213129.1 YbaB/EbfC family nucleoid-associated protein [Planctomycetota bacterium]
MFKNIGNIASMLKQAQEMQGRMADVQENLGQMKLHGEAGGGMVNVEVSGLMKVLRCQIDPVLMQANDQEMLEDLLVAAVNQALEKARETSAEEMAKLTGGFNIPGLNDVMAKLGMGGPSASD